MGTSHEFVTGDYKCLGLGNKDDIPIARVDKGLVIMSKTTTDLASPSVPRAPRGVRESMDNHLWVKTYVHVFSNTQVVNINFH